MQNLDKAIREARDSGYSDEEIIEHIGGKFSSAISTARENNYSDTEILDFLSTQYQPTKKEAIFQPYKDILGTTKDIATQGLKDVFFPEPFNLPNTEGAYASAKIGTPLQYRKPVKSGPVATQLRRPFGVLELASAAPAGAMEGITKPIERATGIPSVVSDIALSALIPAAGPATMARAPSAVRKASETLSEAGDAWGGAYRAFRGVDPEAQRDFLSHVERAGTENLPKSKVRFPTGRAPDTGRLKQFQNWINQEYYERAVAPWSIANQKYDIARAAGNGKVADAGDVFRKFDDALAEFAEDARVGLDPAQSAAFREMKILREDMRAKYGDSNKIEYNDLADLNKAINSTFKNRDLGTAAGRKRAEFKAILQEKINSLPDETFVRALNDANDYWQYNVAKPFHDNPLLEKIWNRDRDFYAWKKQQENPEIPVAPPPDSTDRAVRMMDNIKGPGEIEALASVLPPDKFAEIAQARFRYGSSERPSILRAIGQAATGHPIRSVRDVFKAALQGGSDPLIKYADDIRLAQKYRPKATPDTPSNASITPMDGGTLPGGPDIYYTPPTGGSPRLPAPEKRGQEIPYDPEGTRAWSESPSGEFVDEAGNIRSMTKEEKAAADVARRERELEKARLDDYYSRREGIPESAPATVRPSIAEEWAASPSDYFSVDKSGTARRVGKGEGMYYDYIGDMRRDAMNPGIKDFAEGMGLDASGKSITNLTSEIDEFQDWPPFLRPKKFAKGGAVRPTEAQKEAGNYKKGHRRVHGLSIAIENPKGSTRSGTGKDGKRWSSKMAADYGYIKGTTGKDGDHVGCYIGPNEKSRRVYVIDQKNDEGKFDEHKCMIGFADRSDAMRAYRASFSDNKNRIMKMTRMDINDFKEWIKNGNTKKPIGRAA